MNKYSNSFILFFLALIVTFCMSINNADAESLNSTVFVPATNENVKLDKYDSVSSKTTDVWTLTLCKGNTYRIYVNGDGDTDLDLYVYDENDNLIDSDTDGLDLCICHVTPKWTGKFKVKIKNLGEVYNKYHFKITYE